MSLAPGTRLGAYEIVALIGAGGMGEVYRARDTRLGRDVAIKVLPSQFAADADLRARFEREARTVSSLDHPHICPLYDVGEHDGIAYLVMPHLEGETLEQRLRNGALPIDQALQYGIEIADALDKAHRKGIVHRDLKPGNIMLTKSGATLLDFGLAKARPAAVAGNLSMLPTTPPNLTAQGMLLGTFQYMAPEQLEGGEADARSDIFAFGAVLYEMVTGKRAFEGKSQASLISAIMSSTPAPLSALQPLSPPGLDRVVKKCLEKDPDERWQSAHDLEDELKWVAEGSAATAVAPAASRAGHRSSARLAWATVGVLSVALIAGALLWGRERWRATPDGADAIRFSATLPEGWVLARIQPGGGATAPLAVSPDGRQLAFVGLGPDRTRKIWIRALDSLTAVPLTGTEGGSAPFWSPDSRSIGFFADGSLKKIDAAGGPAITLCAVTRHMGGTWGTSGVIVFATAPPEPLQKVSASGGVPTPATRFGKGETQHWRPSFLPDGRHFLYRSNTVGEKGPFYVASIDSTDSTLVLQADSSNAIYSQGHLLFLLGTTLMAQPFDPERLVLSGEPTPVAEPIQTQSPVPIGMFSASANGVLAYRTGENSGTDLVWFDRAGKVLSKLGEPALYLDLELSPDGRRLAVGVMDAGPRGTDLWIFDIARNFRTRFTSDPAQELGARWTADGKDIAYYVEGKGLFLKPSGGSGAERRLLEAAHNEYPDDWTADGRSLLFERDDAKTSWDLWVLPLESGAKPYPFIQAPLRQEYGRFSPDGRWVAYRSTESGREEIYVVPFPGPGDKVQVSTNGGNFPRWRRDGKEIFYLRVDGMVVASAVDGSAAAFRAGVETPLFDGNTVMLGNWPYDVTADGQRFVVNSRLDDAPVTPVTVVVNWAALKK